MRTSLRLTNQSRNRSAMRPDRMTRYMPYFAEQVRSHPRNVVWFSDPFLTNFWKSFSAEAYRARLLGAWNDRRNSCTNAPFLSGQGVLTFPPRHLETEGTQIVRCQTQICLCGRRGDVPKHVADPLHRHGSAKQAHGARKTKGVRTMPAVYNDSRFL